MGRRRGFFNGRARREAESRLEHGRIYARVSGNGGAFQAGKFRDSSAAPMTTAWLFTTNARTCCMRFLLLMLPTCGTPSPCGLTVGPRATMPSRAMDAVNKPQHDGFCAPFFDTTLVRAFVVALAVSQARETRLAASATKCKAGFPQIAMTPESSTWRRIRIILMVQVFCGRRLAFLSRRGNCHVARDEPNR